MLALWHRSVCLIDFVGRLTMNSNGNRVVDKIIRSSEDSLIMFSTSTVPHLITLNLTKNGAFVAITAKQSSFLILYAYCDNHNNIMYVVYIIYIRSYVCILYTSTEPHIYTHS